MTVRAASRTSTCPECGWAASKWVGRCPQCQARGTLEEGRTPCTRTSVLAPTSPATPITEIPTTTSVKQSTGTDEFDRALGGGLVPGAVVLLAGEPGVGKSTLLLDVVVRIAEAAVQSGRAPMFYISGEESASQVRPRTGRIGVFHDHLHLTAEFDLVTILSHVDSVRPSLPVVDPVQTAADPQTEGAADGVAQVRGVTSMLVADAKTRPVPVLLVGHVTKEDSIAGLRVLEHLVDVVCQSEGDRHSPLRMIRAVKNRYGPIGEVGCFEPNEAGIRGLADPSGLFLPSRRENVPGTCVTMALGGRRSMLVEVQALIVPSSGSPKRTTSGLESSRAAIAIAVSQLRFGFDLGRCDVFLSTVGGVRSTEPATDAAMALALASARLSKPLTAEIAAIGEVSLTGELRPMTGIQQRLAEARRLGFGVAIVPRGTCEANVKVPGGPALLECDDIPEVVARESPV